MSRSDLSGGRPFAGAVIGAGIVTACWWGVNLLDARAPGWIPHATSHMSTGIVVVLAGLWLMRILRQVGLRSWAGRAGPAVFMGGVVFFALAQAAETIAAIVEYPETGWLHETASLFAALGLVIILVGAAWLVVVAIIRRVLPGWMLPVVILLGLLVLFGVMGGPSVLTR